MASDRPVTALEAVAALGDRQRSRLYDVVRKARKPVTREEAARAVDMSRKLAAFHLEKLVASGLLEVVLEPLPGPRGVGRTPKRYRPAASVVSVSLPPRSYERLASVLVDAVSEVDGGGSMSGAVSEAALEHGRQRGAELSASPVHGVIGHEGPLARAEAALVHEGFDPYRSGPDSVRLSNCPFAPLAERSPGVVCAVNVDYVTGLLAGLGLDSVDVHLSQVASECCLEISVRQ